MRRGVAAVVVVVVLGALATGAAVSASSAHTPAQVVARFKALTRTTLVVDKRSSYPGHYAALGVPQSISNIGRYSRFTIWVVTSGSEEDVHDLLANPHTGELGVPGPSAIYWERGTTIGGSVYWLAKKRYGTDVVLWWYGSKQKIDATFQRLHRPLTAIAAMG
jgi:hypothetical protein